MRRLLNGEFCDRIGRLLVIDCRYPFEYEGGHIRGAINTHNPLDIASVSAKVSLRCSCSFYYNEWFSSLVQMLFKEPPPPRPPSKREGASSGAETTDVSRVSKGVTGSVRIAQGVASESSSDCVASATVELTETPRPIIAVQAAALADSPATCTVASLGLSHGPSRSFSVMSVPADLHTLDAQQAIALQLDGENALLFQPVKSSMPAASSSYCCDLASTISCTPTSEKTSLGESQCTFQASSGSATLERNESTGDSKSCLSSPVLRIAAPPQFYRPRRLASSCHRLEASGTAMISSASASMCRSPIVVEVPHRCDGSSSLNASSVDSLLPTALPQVIVFHCEFSQSRGPDMLRAVRTFDRRLNLHAYPALSFPQLYLLHKGYRNLREEQPALCEPQSGSYVAMDDPRYRALLEVHSKERKRGMKLFKGVRTSAELRRLLQSNQAGSPPLVERLAASTTDTWRRAIPKRVHVPLSLLLEENDEPEAEAASALNLQLASASSVA